MNFLGTMICFFVKCRGKLYIPEKKKIYWNFPLLGLNREEVGWVGWISLKKVDTGHIVQIWNY